MRIIQYIKEAYGNWGIKKKMYSVFVLGLCAYILVFTGYIQVMYHFNLKQEYIINRERIIDEFVESMYSEIAIVNNMSLSIMRANPVREFLNSEEPDYRKTSQAQTELYQVINTEEPIESVYMIHENGSTIFINYYGVDVKRRSVFSEEWKRALEAENGGAIVALNGNGAFQDGLYPVLSHMRAVYDLDTQKKIGYLVINISMDFLNSKIEQFWNESDTFVAIQTPDHQIVAQKGQEEIAERISHQISRSKIENTETETIGNHVIIQTPIKDWGLQVYYISSLGLGQILTQNFILFAMLILAVTIVFLILFSRIISVFITNPITVLVKYMNKVKNESYLYRVTLKTNNDEIGMLKDTYNSMLVRINQLITDLLEEERQKNKMELDVLQEQINPHFLYNTLSSIEYLTLIDDSKGAYQALQTLGNFYRNFLSGGSSVITLEQELEITRDYISLQKLRFKNIVELKIDADEALYSRKILRLILQPLVENSLMHGIYPKGENGIIQISVRTLDDKMEVVVEDNGVGMDVNKIYDLLQQKKHVEEEPHFGLLGTLLRIQYYYNTTDFYKLESEPGIYTRITLHLPYIY